MHIFACFERVAVKVARFPFFPNQFNILGTYDLYIMGAVKLFHEQQRYDKRHLPKGDFPDYAHVDIPIVEDCGWIYGGVIPELA